MLAIHFRECICIRVVGWLREDHVVLKENISNMAKEKWKVLDLRAPSRVHMSLAKNILANVVGALSTKKSCEG
ncbi:hypothetical protein MTR_5g027140 [Medicago truncatula]|uniref:Uncharacterized protein n=1 Tax=Medicago truncatula TaxID=3880 RepID=G7K850_MEDTR|nr:hypothetical protein MTR_5g027140 [Medicago truncatula]